MNLIALPFLVIIGAVLYLFAKSMLAKTREYSQSYERLSLKEFDAVLQELGNENIKAFTNSHPYVWVENSIEETRKKIMASCPRSRYGTAAALAKYQLRVNHEQKYIYVALNKNSKDAWPELKIYEEWLESNREVAENIARYNENESRNA